MRNPLTKRIKFWGTRGSCPVSGTEYSHFGGNTSCLEILYENNHLIFDAGTGIRPLGESLISQKKGPIHLFLSHTHWDHIIGFPFFKLLECPGQEITIWSPQGEGRSTRELFHEMLAPEFFPMGLDEIAASLSFKTIEEKKPIQINSLLLDFHRTHHNGIAFCFKIKTPHQTIGYATDNEIFHGYHGKIDQIPKETLKPHLSLIHFLSECDLFIHEAQYFPDEYREKVSWGHSSLLNTIALVKESQVKHWLVVHHDPKHTDQDLKNLESLASQILQENQIDCKAQWIGDGFELYLS